MKILLTDSRRIYDQTKSDNKILINPLKDLTLTAIEETNFIEEAKRLSINDQFLIHNLKYSESVVTEIESLKNFLIESNPENREDQLMPFLHASVKEQLIKKYAIRNLFEILKQGFEDAEFTAKLSEDYALAKDLQNVTTAITTYKSGIHKKLLLQLLKSKIYRWVSRKRIISKPEKIRWMFLLYDSIHHHELISQVYGFIPKEVEVVWVVVDSGLDKVEEITHLLPDEARVCKLDSFKASPRMKRQGTLDQIKAEMKNLNVANAKFDLHLSEVKTAFMERAFEEIKPSKCFHISYHEVGRIMVNVARKLGVPSYSLDYSYITDDFRFEKGITFDHKFVPSSDQSRIWKKRNDLSNHHIVGFPKYDHWHSFSFEQLNTRKKFGIGSGTVILLASSYGFDHSIRRFQIRQLIDICKKNSWGLLIKKHPLEVDHLVEETVDECNVDWVKIYHHQDISAIEAIDAADVTISAGSSIVMDCLLVGRPFISLSQNAQSSFSDLMPVCAEQFVETVYSLDEVESAVESLTNRNIDYSKIRDRYLGPLDGNSAQRMLKVLLQDD
ncbi:hypothetical protein [Ekhidna sp.]